MFKRLSVASISCGTMLTLFILFGFTLHLINASVISTIISKAHNVTSALSPLGHANSTLPHKNISPALSENFTFTWSNGSPMTLYANQTATSERQEVDCLGLGSTIAGVLENFLEGKANGSQALDVRFYVSSRKQPQRVQVMVGNQFGLEWVDFRIERRTVFIVHGFLSHSNETWIRDMEEAFLLWGDVNVVVVDWSAGGNTWNYYKAVVNTRIVGQQITRFLNQVINATLEAQGQDSKKWGPLHLVGHSLGAHICGFVANRFKAMQNKWIIQRITGLDPAQPCFRQADLAMQLDKTDAQYVDIIHTNGRLLSKLGLGLPQPIGHADFYPNGGMKQPGCIMGRSSFFDFLPISKSKIEQTICSHGRSYLYLTESLITAASQNCTFWARSWDLTYRHAVQTFTQPCDMHSCVEMGINAEQYPHRGSFYVVTGETPPFCVGSTAVGNQSMDHLLEDLTTELED